MQLFPTNTVYSALIVDGNQQALSRESQIEDIRNNPEEYVVPPSIPTEESFVYNISDEYLSVDINYNQVYDTPISKQNFKKLIALKVLASVVRIQNNNRITQELLNQLFPALTIDQLVNQFKSSGHVKIERDTDSFIIDLGKYARIPSAGPGSIRYNINETIIDRVYNILSELTSTDSEKYKFEYEDKAGTKVTVPVTDVTTDDIDLWLKNLDI